MIDAGEISVFKLRISFVHKFDCNMQSFKVNVFTLLLSRLRAWTKSKRKTNGIPKWLTYAILLSILIMFWLVLVSLKRILSAGHMLKLISILSLSCYGKPNTLATLYIDTKRFKRWCLIHLSNSKIDAIVLCIQNFIVRSFSTSNIFIVKF